MKRIINEKKQRGVALGLCLLGFFSLLSCNKSEYQQMVERELAKGERQDSLFLGLHFGMKRQDFFKRCMALNSQHITLMGLKSNMPMRKFEDSVGLIYMHFYPEFNNDKIYEMQAFFTYKDWSPFVPNTHPDSLLLRTKRRLETWYGKGFIRVERPERNDFAYVKVDGNRQIVMFVSGETDVKVLFTDLLAKPKKSE